MLRFQGSLTCMEILESPKIPEWSLKIRFRCAQCMASQQYKLGWIAASWAILAAQSKIFSLQFESYRPAHAL